MAGGNIPREVEGSSAPVARTHWVDSMPARSVLSVLFWGWVFLSGALLALLGLVLFLPFNPWTDPHRRVMEWVNRQWGRAVYGAMPALHIEAVGLERLREGEGPYVICPNHQSVADIPLMLSLLPQAKFIAKPSAFWVPPMGLQLRLAGYIPAGRGGEGEAQHALARAQGWLARGRHILVFPEGTRSPDTRVQRFGQGPFALAAQAGVAVLPVAISGTGHALARGAFRYRFRGHIRVEFLPPVPVTEAPRAAASQVRALIQQALLERGVRS